MFICKTELVFGPDKYAHVSHLHECPVEEFCEARDSPEHAGHPATRSPATKCQLSPQIIIKSRNGPINFQRSTGGQYSFCQEPSPPLSVARTLTLPLGGPVTPEDAKRTEKHTAESQSKVKVSSLASGRKRRGARQQ